MKTLRSNSSRSWRDMTCRKVCFAERFMLAADLSPRTRGAISQRLQKMKPDVLTGVHPWVMTPASASASPNYGEAFSEAGTGPAPATASAGANTPQFFSRHRWRCGLIQTESRPGRTNTSRSRSRRRRGVHQLRLRMAVRPGSMSGPRHASAEANGCDQSTTGVATRLPGICAACGKL